LHRNQHLGAGRIERILIRAATEQDIPRLVEMGQRFRAETSYSQFLSDNPGKMAELGAKLVSQDGVLVSQRNDRVVGMLGMILHSHFISGERMAGEVFWYVEPAYRGEGIKLMSETEKRARAAGAQHIQMIAPNDQVAAVYRRMGYQFVEATYQKAL
jgi:GNAT superfamily N-acetyltransferase